MFEPYPQEAAFAAEVVNEAAALAHRIESEMVVTGIEKDDRSPVTVADFSAQALVASRLADRFPDDPLVAEERSRLLRTENSDARAAVMHYVRTLLPKAGDSQVFEWIDRGAGRPADRFWTLDPIDGTAGFLRHDQWVVALALIESGQVVLGALACPHLDVDLQPSHDGAGTVVLAVRGEGAWAAPAGGADYRQLHTSSRSEPAEARLMGSVEPGHTDMAMMARVRARLGIETPVVKMDSQAKFAAVAGGQADLILRLLSPDHLDYREKIWDQAAGSLIVREAGGDVTDLRGRPLDFSAGVRLTANIGVLVSNGPLHPAALAALEAEGAAEIDSAR
ncbi:MAG: 3'(2'),5'-bisphosphate nucleotidase [Anaerolineales bacterium]